MKFLIVDDNAGMRKLIGAILTENGHDFDECSNGSQALEQYRLSRPDCVLMDVVMPGIDGIEATRRIKAAFPDARIVMITDFNDPGLRLAAQEAGAEGFVPKEDLSVLRNLCLKRQGQPGHPEPNSPANRHVEGHTHMTWRLYRAIRRRWTGGRRVLLSPHSQLMRQHIK